MLHLSSVSMYGILLGTHFFNHWNNGNPHFTSLPLGLTDQPFSHTFCLVSYTFNAGANLAPFALSWGVLQILIILACKQDVHHHEAHHVLSGLLCYRKLPCR